MIDINEVTSGSLRRKKYLTEFPEYYLLENFVENNPWHDNQNVLEHVIGVFEGLEHVLLFNDLDPHERKHLQTYLATQTGNMSREGILKSATLLHDIAKSITLIKTPDGISRCPGHELIAAGMVIEYADRFGMDKIASGYVERIVHYHGFVSDILNLMLANGKKETYLKIFLTTVGDIDVELVLFMQSDLLGSDLKKTDRNAFDQRMSLLSWMLAQNMPS
jgi:hypothetical protein